eukprot:365535-Chlamydomonas_euryale.AAC.51
MLKEEGSGRCLRPCHGLEFGICAHRHSRFVLYRRRPTWIHVSAAGTMGLKANLTCGEILEQLVHARRETRIRNIVFMGMGEPLK